MFCGLARGVQQCKNTIIENSRAFKAFVHTAVGNILYYNLIYKSHCVYTVRRGVVRTQKCILTCLRYYCIYTVPYKRDPNATN